MARHANDGGRGAPLHIPSLAREIILADVFLKTFGLSGAEWMAPLMIFKQVEQHLPVCKILPQNIAGTFGKSAVS